MKLNGNLLGLYVKVYKSLDFKAFLHFPIKNLTLLVSFTTMEVHTVGMIERNLNGKE